MRCMEAEQDGTVLNTHISDNDLHPINVTDMSMPSVTQADKDFDGDSDGARNT